PRTGATSKHGHLRRLAVALPIELPAQRLLDESTQRVAAPPGGRLRSCKELVVDGNGGAHIISIYASNASSMRPGSPAPGRATATRCGRRGPARAGRGSAGPARTGPRSGP